MQKVQKVIHNLRQQPDDVKHHILHVVTAVCAVILLVLWVFSLGGDTKTVDANRDEVKLKPFAVLKANLVDGYQSISE